MSLILMHIAKDKLRWKEMLQESRKGKPMSTTGDKLYICILESQVS